MSNTARQFGSHAYEREKDDWYVEPRWCVEALACAEPFRGNVYDPACGGGNIPSVFSERGHNVLATDIIDRDSPHYDGTLDFLACDLDALTEAVGGQVDNIVCNPPYKLAQEFTSRALQIATAKVAMLVSLTFLESQKRRPWFQETCPETVWVCATRPSMPPGGSTVKATGGKRPYCWIVWHQGYRGDTRLRWLP